MFLGTEQKNTNKIKRKKIKKLPTEKQDSEYWQLLINNKDKWSLTPEEKQDNDWLKDVSYNPIEIKNDNKKK